MNAFLVPFLEFSKKAYRKTRLPFLQPPPSPPPFTVLKGEAVSEAIANLIDANKPGMLARFGVGELNATYRYAHISRKLFNPIHYIMGYAEPGWWTKDLKWGMPIYNGFFPTTDENLSRFGELMLNDMKLVDILGTWQPKELFFEKELSGTIKIALGDLEPYSYQMPWSKSLEGKKVLVIHPFEKSIIQQYKKRELLFKDKNVLPEFELITIKAVQSVAGNNEGYKSWFDALEHMKSQIDAVTFDVAILGCGAYGFPLAAHIKRIGKVAIHLGGPVQLLFGIKGKRWEAWPSYEQIFNEHWIKPLEEDTPKNKEAVEDGCYW